MTTGQIMVMTGGILVAAAVLLIALGSIVLHNKKTKVLLEIEREYH